MGLVAPWLFTGDLRLAKLDNQTKRKLEHLFGMRSGYVLDFSNDSFADFVETAINIDPYRKFDPTLSKARLLRKIWETEDATTVRRLNSELLEHWYTTERFSDVEISQNDLSIYEDLLEQYGEPDSNLSAEGLEFLNKDLGEIDFTSLSKELTAQDLTSDRLREIELCVNAGAYLAVMFLAGSTIEGLLLEVAEKNVMEFEGAASAPRDKRGKALATRQWGLSSLITTSRELGLLSDDTERFAHHIRNYRNYIHPRQQAKQSFQPKRETAEIAFQVVKAVLRDLQTAFSD